MTKEVLLSCWAASVIGVIVCGVIVVCSGFHSTAARISMWVAVGLMWVFNIWQSTKRFSDEQ